MAQKLSKKTGDINLPKVPKTRTTKSLGPMVDKYHAIREQRLAIDRYAKEWKAEENRLYEHILSQIPKGDGGAVGKEYKAIRTESDVYSIDDDKAFYAYVKKTGSFDLLNRAVNQKAVRERMDDPKFMKANKGKVPGLKSFKKLGLSVTKVK